MAKFFYATILLFLGWDINEIYINFKKVRWPLHGVAISHRHFHLHSVSKCPMFLYACSRLPTFDFIISRLHHCWNYQKLIKQEQQQTKTNADRQIKEALRHLLTLLFCFHFLFIIHTESFSSFAIKPCKKQKISTKQGKQPRQNETKKKIKKKAYTSLIQYNLHAYDQLFSAAMN